MTGGGRFAQPFKDYEILGRLGSGGMGTVFRARRKSDGLELAIKVLRPSLSRHSRYVERLRREAEISMRLDHPNLVRAYGFGEEGGYHYLVMDYCPGRTLSALLKAWGRFPEDQVLDLGIQVCDALAYTHEHHVIHRDIKPANLLVDEDGRTKLTDLGLAKAATDPALTRDGGTVGTPQYMSPEQAQAPASVDERSDLYALGATLYHMLVGMPPFEGESAVQVITKLLHERPVPAASVNPEVSEGLDLILRRLLMKRPEERYGTAREVLLDLEAVRDGLAPAIDARALARAEGAQEQVTTAHPRWWLLGLSSAVGAALIVVFWLVWTRTPTQQPAALGLAKLRQIAVDGQRDFRERLEVLGSFKAASASEGLELQSLRQKVLSEFDRALSQFHERWTRTSLERWLRERGTLASAEAAFENEQDIALQQRFRGYRSASLPAELRSLHSSLRDAELRQVAQLVEARVSAVLAACRKALDTVLRPRVQKLAAQHDYAQALVLLDQALDAPLSMIEGDDAAKVALPQQATERLHPIRRRLQALREKLLVEAQALVDARSNRLREALDLSHRHFIGGFPERALRELLTLRRRLASAPTWHSLPPGMDDETQTWRARIDAETRRVRDRLQKLDLESLVLAEDAVHARLAQDLDVDAAVKLLEAYRFATSAGRELRDALRRDLLRLRSLLVALPQLLTAAQSSGGRPQGGQGMLRWQLRDGGFFARLHEVNPGPPPRFSLRRRGGGSRECGVLDLDPGWLSEQIEGARGAAQHRLGLGLLLYYLDDFDRAFAALRSHHMQRFLAARKRREALLARSQSGERQRAQRILDQARKLAENSGPLAIEVLTPLLDELESDFAQERIIKDAADELRELRRRCAAERRRRELVQMLPERLRQDVQLLWAPEQQLALRLDFKGPRGFSKSLSPWIKRDRGLLSPPAQGLQPRAEQRRALVLGLPVFDLREPLTLELQLAIPSQERPLEALGIDLFGSRILLLGNLEDGGRVLGDAPKDLRLALARSIAQPAADWAFVYGARFDLTLTLGRVEAGVRDYSLRFAGRLIAEGRVTLPRVPHRNLQISAIAPLVIEDLELRGTAR